MTTQTQQSPKRWRHSNQGVSTPTMTSTMIYDASGVYVASAINSIQADKLVSICNSHAELLEALKLVAWQHNMPCGTQVTGEQRAAKPGRDGHSTVNETIERYIEAAIAKATHSQETL